MISSIRGVEGDVDGGSELAAAVGSWIDAMGFAVGTGALPWLREGAAAGDG